MFIRNKYFKWYFNIISKAQSRDVANLGYVEKHHIIPKSLGGDDSVENLIVLTAKEHFICHLLLTKMTEKNNRKKMVYAAWRMSVQAKTDQGRYKVSSKIYETIKQQRNEYLKSLIGPLNPNFGKKTGRTSEDFTPEWRAKISESRKGKSAWNKGISRTTEERAKMSATRKARANDPTWNIRPPCRPETAQKIKEANLDKRWVYRISPFQRKYVSANDFAILCSDGWIPGFGPR
jgi:hypothetical protein